MPLVNKQPFKPNPIPENLNSDDEVFYHELTNEIFTSHDAFVDRFLYCNSLIWTCSRTGKSGLTYKEALESELQCPRRNKRKRKDKSEGLEQEQQKQTQIKQPKEPKQKQHKEGDKNDTFTENDSIEPVKKKKKKYPYDPKKYSMPVPEGFDPALLTPTGKIDGRKLKSKKNIELANELLSKTQSSTSNKNDTSKTTTSSPQKKGKHKKKEEEARKKEEEARRKEEEAKKKAQLQAELAKERELEAKRKKEAAALAKQLERQKKEEERKKAVAFLQNWEKKCEDLERDDLRRLPPPIPVKCDIPEKLFGDAVFILESLFNLHELYDIKDVFPEGVTYDNLEEMLIEKHEEGPLGTIITYLLRIIFNFQSTTEGYGLDDAGTCNGNDTSSDTIITEVTKQEPNTKVNNVQVKNEMDIEQNGLSDHGSEHEEDDDKEVRMNDLIGAAIKAAQEVKKSLSKPLAEMELNSSNVTEVLRLHILQSGSFPKGRTIYSGWYSSREDPGLWLCMQEPDLMKKLENVTIYELDMEERIKILHTLIYQLFSFIRTRTYIEQASDSLTELRKAYRKEAAEFAKWDRENCVKRMWPPKRKTDQNSVQNSNDKSNGGDQNNIKSDLNNQNSNPCSVDGDAECDNNDRAYHDDKEIISNSKNKSELKSCLKSNGTNNNNSTTPDNVPINNDIDNDITSHNNNNNKKKSITFKTGMNGTNVGAIGDELADDGEMLIENEQDNDEKNQQNGVACNDSEQNFEELERAYQQNLVDYEDYQRERAIRYEQLNTVLLDIRKNLRLTQSVYGVHPIGRDRAYRRYWIFQSLPGLFVEQDEEFLGKCLPEPTPLESRYKKLFNKENPLMHPNEADLIRTKTCEVGCSTDPIESEQHQPETETEVNNNNNNSNNDNHNHSEKPENNEQKSNSENPLSEHGGELPDDSDVMNYCTGDETSCAIHGQKRPTQPKWWFYHTPESIDSLVESLNKRGLRESELHDLLSVESILIKEWIAECPSFKLNKDILEQSGIRRSRRLKTKGNKRRGRYDRD